VSLRSLWAVGSVATLPVGSRQCRYAPSRLQGSKDLAEIEKEGQDTILSVNPDLQEKDLHYFRTPDPKNIKGLYSINLLNWYRKMKLFHGL